MGVTFGNENAAAAMPQAGGWPGHHKEIGKIRHGNAEIGLRVVAVPNIG